MGRIITPFPGTKAHQTRIPVSGRPCEHRQVTGDGRVVCGKAPKGDTEVSPTLCASCPATLVDCKHLRYTLRKHAPVPIVVRYAGGRTEVWDDVPPAMRFARAACVLRREAICGPADCAGCTLRMALPTVTAMEDPRRTAAMG